jgi:hypothetical protein
MRIDDPHFEVHAYQRDTWRAENVSLAQEYWPKIMAYTQVHRFASAYELYHDLELYDIPMYLALHDLIEQGILTGPDPYADDAPESMVLWLYYPKEVGHA